MKTSTDDNVLRGRSLNLADYTFARHGVQVPSGTTLEDVLTPSFFRNYAHLVKPGSQILVLSDDYLLDVSLRVLTVNKAEVTCRLMSDASPKQAAKPKKAVTEGVEASWGGPKHMWRVTSGSEVIEHGFGSKEEAEAAAEKHKAA